MPSSLGLFLFLSFILWLFFRDYQRRGGISPALWIPVIWVAILGSKPISFWFGLSVRMENPDDFQEGSPLDRFVFLLLILAGCLVLSKRRIDWKAIFAKNRWIFLFYLYLGISVMWSDYPFVSFKRWVKDIGNLVMVFVVITESDPIAAIKAVLARCTYLLVPLSVLFIKFYPSLGYVIHQLSWEPTYVGVAMEKNALGNLALVCGLFLFWNLIGLYTRTSKAADKTELWIHVMLLLMIIWLLVKARCSTALACIVLGIVILLGMRRRAVRQRVRYLGHYALAAVLSLFVLHITLNIGELLVQTLGRDVTFTGRTELWQDVLATKINPVVGTGYASFWSGERAQEFREKYWWHPNQAHNGYLETYLNSGLIGVCLLAALLLAAFKSTKNELLSGSDYGSIRFAYLAAAVFNNFTEALFNRLGLVWFFMLLASVEFPRALRRKSGREAKIAAGRTDQIQERWHSPVFPRERASATTVCCRGDDSPTNKGSI